MGFFNRHNGPVDPRATTRTAGTTTEKRAHRHRGHHREGYFNARPSFGQWLKGTLIDLLTMVAIGVLGIGIYLANPAPTRSFPVTFADGQIVYPQFAYPLRNEIVPIWASALISVLVPIAVFLIVQIRVRSFWDLNNSCLGLFYSIITAAVFQVFLKWLIGGLRPHFLDVCKPDLSRMEGTGFKGIMYDRRVCTGDQKEINDSLESFPSGHSTAAFAGFVYLYLYLNAKLKIFSNYHPHMWKLVAVYAPILGATLIAGALTIDEFHNWYDCLAGAVIGTFMAFSAYRMVFASVWDFRFNHIPLSRNIAFNYTDGQAEYQGFRDAIFTRKAGWGDLEMGMSTGAPFDATSAVMGGGHIGTHHHGTEASNGIARRPVGGTV